MQDSLVESSSKTNVVSGNTKSENDACYNVEPLSTVQLHVEASCVSNKSFNPTKNCLKHKFFNELSLPNKCKYITCFVLSSWDNIVGPQALIVWAKPFYEKCEKHIKCSISSQKNFSTSCTFVTGSYQGFKKKSNTDTSGSELNIEKQEVNGGPNVNDDLKSIVHYVTEHGVGVADIGKLLQDRIVTSFVVVPHKAILVIDLKFVVVENNNDVPYCLSMIIPQEEEVNFYPLLDTCTSFLKKTEGFLGGRKITSNLICLCDMLLSLQDASLPLYPLQTIKKLSFDTKFCELLLTSHLQTLGTSVIVSKCASLANEVILWLAHFSEPEDLHISRLCFSYLQWPFFPGLALQGLVKNSVGELNLSAKGIMESCRSLTIVDLDTGTVRQTSPLDIHNKKSSLAFNQYLISLWCESSDIAATSESLFEPVKQTSPVIKQFLNGLDQLEICEDSIKLSFIKNFLRTLKYTAMGLITWVKHECITNEDLLVYLAQAELLQPGFYDYVRKGV